MKEKRRRKRTSRIWTISKEELQEKIDRSDTLSEVLQLLGYNSRSAGSFRQLKKRIKEDKLVLENLIERREIKKKDQIKNLNIKTPLSDLFTKKM